MPTTDRKLRVFLCHASQDKPIVRELYQRLLAEGWIDPWLDEEKLLPGMDWDLEIEKAVENTDVVIACLSNSSVSKEGYVQRELRFVLDIALEKPEGAIFVIPLRLENCQPPRRLRLWQYLDYFPSERREWAHKRLLKTLYNHKTLQYQNGIIEHDYKENFPLAQDEGKTKSELEQEISVDSVQKNWSGKKPSKKKKDSNSIVSPSSKKQKKLNLSNAANTSQYYQQPQSLFNTVGDWLSSRKKIRALLILSALCICYLVTFYSYLLYSYPR